MTMAIMDRMKLAGKRGFGGWCICAMGATLWIEVAAATFAHLCRGRFGGTYAASSEGVMAFL
jgi:hypothetical protein